MERQRREAAVKQLQDEMEALRSRQAEKMARLPPQKRQQYEVSRALPRELQRWLAC